MAMIHSLSYLFDCTLTFERISVETPDKWLEGTMLASRRLLEGEQATRHHAATPLTHTV